MNFVTLLSKNLLDFIFPKSTIALKLENILTSEMLAIFPSPRALKGENTIALFDYQDQNVRDLVWEIKYSANRTLARKVAEIAYEVLCHELAERVLFENFINPILCPMPISKERLREKGFNQAEIICEEIKKLDKENLFTYDPKILIKIKHTESQTKSVNKSERLKNIEGSMLGDNQKLHKKCVVLMDDVITTVATASEAMRALRQAGARKILVLSIAH
ncbi:MAG: hypothetical protein M3Q24_01800 [bacterium]|nr:hypothetical protein [bacterium]